MFIINLILLRPTKHLERLTFSYLQLAFPLFRDFAANLSAALAVVVNLDDAMALGRKAMSVSII